ncbi:putative all-trans-nonaprenyl-diphosphate synthase (geranylgeranyl-diphosphate specific) [Helianthus debilis subsp. tardiflorus]
MMMPATCHNLEFGRIKGDEKVAKCRVFSTEAPETLLNGDAPGPSPVLSVKKESKADLFEVVSDDLLTLNKNLQSIVGAENPVLMSAAEQIFSVAGKRMRPTLVFLVSRATLALTGLEHLAEIIEMIHTTSLIHDDVLDESDMRRGKEIVHQLYGTRVAVLAGDFMFAQSSWSRSYVGRFGSARYRFRLECKGCFGCC